MNKIKTADAEEAILEKYHYKQELRRSLKLFSSFAVAFSFISITTGIFTNYQDMLITGGPAGIWTWPIAVAGQILVACIFAELAGIIPLSGYSYQWIKRLSSPFMGWLTGWISFCFLVLVIPAVDAGLAPVLAMLLNIEIQPANITMIVLVMLAIQAALNIAGVKLASIINDSAVYTETVGIVGLTLIIGGMVFFRDTDYSVLWSTGNAVAEGQSYFLPFIMTILMGSFTLVGFEASANLSEETINAHDTVPKAIIFSVVISGIFGFLFLIVITLAIPDLASVLASENPLPYIINHSLGSFFGKLFLILVCISIFACGLVITTSASRLVYAMSRDNVFFFGKTFSKVSAQKRSPVRATILIWILCSISILFADSLKTLVAATAVLPALIYLITIVGYLLVRKKVTLLRENSFSLGKFALPVFILSILWLITEIAILTIPEGFHNATLISVGLITAGAGFYFILFKKNMERHVSESEKISGL
ncbi:MAG: amino acid permease [Cyclobacteriaceae bacterium]|nr:amino acid permease [Cyclobacteriaceae bacterium]